SSRFDPSQRPRRTIRQSSLSGRAPPSRVSPKHEPRCELLRQRLHGILLRHHQDRTRNDRIPKQPSGSPGHRQLPRLLQPRPPTLLTELPHSSRFRGSTQPFHLSNSTVRNLPSSSGKATGTKGTVSDCKYQATASDALLRR